MKAFAKSAKKKATHWQMAGESLKVWLADFAKKSWALRARYAGIVHRRARLFNPFFPVFYLDSNFPPHLICPLFQKNRQLPHNGDLLDLAGKQAEPVVRIQFDKVYPRAEFAQIKRLC